MLIITMRVITILTGCGYSSINLIFLRSCFSLSIFMFNSNSEVTNTQIMTLTVPIT